MNNFRLPHLGNNLNTSENFLEKEVEKNNRIKNSKSTQSALFSKLGVDLSTDWEPMEYTEGEYYHYYHKDKSIVLGAIPIELISSVGCNFVFRVVGGTKEVDDTNGRFSDYQFAKRKYFEINEDERGNVISVTLHVGVMYKQAISIYAPELDQLEVKFFITFDDPRDYS